MDQNWEKQLACADICQRCSEPLGNKDRRLLSVYDHQPICMACKKEEEKKPEPAWRLKTGPMEIRPVFVFTTFVLFDVKIDT
jgi:hypothetical protein